MIFREGYKIPIFLRLRVQYKKNFTKEIYLRCLIAKRREISSLGRAH
jgi:hypothetical protein